MVKCVVKQRCRKRLREIRRSRRHSPLSLSLPPIVIWQARWIPFGTAGEKSILNARTSSNLLLWDISPRVTLHRMNSTMVNILTIMTKYYLLKRCKQSWERVVHNKYSYCKHLMKLWNTFVEFTCIDMLFFKVSPNKNPHYKVFRLFCVWHFFIGKKQNLNIKKIFKIYNLPNHRTSNLPF